MNKHTEKAIKETEEAEAWDWAIIEMFKNADEALIFKPNSSEFEKINYDNIKNVAKGSYFTPSYKSGYRWLKETGTKWSLVNWQEFIDYALETESGKKAFQEGLENEKRFIEQKNNKVKAN